MDPSKTIKPFQQSSSTFNLGSSGTKKPKPDDNLAKDGGGSLFGDIKDQS